MRQRASEMQAPGNVNLQQALDEAWGIAPSFLRFGGARGVVSTYEKRAFDLISDALPFGRLWYGGPNAVTIGSTFPCSS